MNQQCMETVSITSYAILKQYAIPCVVGSLRDVKAKVLDCSFEVTEFEHQFRYYVYFWT